MGLATWGDGSCTGREEGTEQQHRCIQRGKGRGDPSLRSRRRGERGIWEVLCTQTVAAAVADVKMWDVTSSLDSYTLPILYQKALKPLKAPLLLKKAIWNTFIINQLFFFFSPLDAQPPPRSCWLCQQRTVCIRTSRQWTCYTKEEWQNVCHGKQSRHLTEKKLLVMHGNFTKLFYTINYQYQLEKHHF